MVVFAKSLTLEGVDVKLSNHLTKVLVEKVCVTMNVMSRYSLSFLWRMIVPILYLKESPYLPRSEIVLSISFNRSIMLWVSPFVRSLIIGDI